MIRLTEIRLDRHAEEMVLGVLRSGQLAQGPMVASFEERFAKVAGTTKAVATSSGTTGLVAAVRALQLKPGDEVITTAFTFVATLNAVVESGATVRLVDIDPMSMTIDPGEIASAINPRTRVVMPVHLYGYPADMDRIAAIAHRGELDIIEDAAQAHGALVGGRPVGSWGLGVFSFYATKNITTGEGGIVTMDDDILADRVRLLRNQGMRARYQYEIVGSNYRMTELQAAIGLSQLEFLDEWTDRRRANARTLVEALRGAEGIDLPVEEDGRRHVFHQFTIRVRDDARVNRDDLAAGLRELGVETGIYYPRAAHDYECFAGHPLILAAPVPHTLEAARQVLSLPVHQWLGPDEVDQVADSVLRVLKGGRAR